MFSEGLPLGRARLDGLVQRARRANLGKSASLVDLVGHFRWPGHFASEVGQPGWSSTLPNQQAQAALWSAGQAGWPTECQSPWLEQLTCCDLLARLGQLAT